MAVELEKKSNKSFYQFKQGYFYLRTNEDSENYQVKEFETKDGLKKYGGVFARKISGMVVNVAIKEAEFEGSKFETLNIEFEDGEVVSFGIGTRTGTQIMSSLPNVDFSKPLVMSAWAIKEEDKIGVTLKQEVNGKEEKIGNFFYDFDTKTEKNGAPTFEGDKNDKDDWNIFFKQQEKFLKKYIKENISTKFSPVVLDKETLEGMLTEEVNPDEIDF